jgi:hypothetical protein
MNDREKGGDPVTAPTEDRDDRDDDDGSARRASPPRKLTFRPPQKNRD